jgi:triosephosphate isomerase
MTRELRPLIAGNWKMNGLAAALAEARAVAEDLARTPAAARVAICPPATLIHRLSEAVAGTPVEIGAQDAHAEPCGAFTGDVCADMLADAGAAW